LINRLLFWKLLKVWAIPNKHNQNKNLTWIPETNFQKQTLDLVFGTESDKTMFLVDDILFINKFSLQDNEIKMLEHDMILATSLRLYSGTTYCYAENKTVKVPSFTKKCVWDWTKEQGDWGYPMSVDGNIYRTNFLKTFIEKLTFSNPNQFEASMDMNKISGVYPKYKCCYVNSPKLVNIPANIVQEQYKNRFNKHISAEEMNKMFLNGKVIDTKHYQGIIRNSCHIIDDIVVI
jgi:hypothetical protein